MKFFACVLISIFLCSSTIFSQIDVQSDSLAQKAARDIWLARNEQMRLDILRDIDLLKPKDQAEYLADLGDIYWLQDNKYSDSLFTKSTEIALSPATEYKDNIEKISVLNHILFFGPIFENNEILSKKLLSEITEIITQEVKNNGSDDYCETLIFLADELLKKDEKVALDFAVLSLKGKKPVLRYSAFKFFVKLKQKNEALSNLYFSKLLELVRTSGDTVQLKNLISIATEYTLNNQKPQVISESQKKDLLSLLTLFIQKESDEITQRNRSDCQLTAYYGNRFVEDYRKLLPQKVGVIEKAISVCKIKTNPNFDGKKPKSSQDFIELAKKTTDQNIKTAYLFSASSLADSENNYKLAVTSLDTIDIDSRNKPGTLWDSLRIQRGSKLITDLIDKKNIAEAAAEISRSPQNLRPYILMDVAKELRYKPEYKQLSLDLLNQAKSELNEMDFLQPTAATPFNDANPARFESMVNTYFRLAEPNEALNTFERFIDIQNQLSSHFTYRAKNGDIFSYYYFESFPGNFLDANFERIYQNTERVDSLKIRLTMRLNILWNNLKSNGFIFTNGMIKIS